MKKYLRSILCLLLALCMVMCFAACDKDEDEEEEEEDSIAGTYVLDSMEADGEEISAEDMADIGFDPETCYIVLEKDGTGTFALAGDTAEIEWDDETLTAEGDSIEYTIKGDKLTIEIDYYKMTFKKTSKKISSEKPEEPKEPEVRTETYELYAAISDGIVLNQSDLASAGMTASNSYILLNNDGTASFTFMGETEQMGWNSTGMWPLSDATDVAAIEFDGDVLTITSDGFSMIFLLKGSNQVPEIDVTSEVVGTYYLYSMTMEGQTLTRTDLQAAGLDYTSIYITFNADNTGELVYDGDAESFKWDEEVLDDGIDEIPYTLDGDILTIESEGVKMSFQK